MRLSKKKEKEFAVKIRQIKELEQQKKQIEESINDKNKTSELVVDVFTVHWSESTSERFDSKAFKNDNEELYAEYLKETTTKRFSIT